jgi:putative hydrolase of the HAD superfamily
MIKAVIFDCFGVLATEAWLPFKTKYFGHDPALFEQASDLARQAWGGLISTDDFIRAVAKLAGTNPDEVSRTITGNIPNEELFDYIRELKPEYKIGFLSNIAGDRLNQIFRPEQLALFDAVAMSFESGLVKPESAAFEDVANRLGVAVNEAVLVDDQQRNVNGALAAGMDGIIYRDVSQLRKELGALLKA